MKLWYEIHGENNFGESALLAKVKSKGLAFIVAKSLSEIYKNVRVV